MKKKKMNLRIFDAGADGGEGNGAGDGNQRGNTGYTFEQAEEIANSRAEKASRAALADFYRRQGMSEAEVTTAIAEFKAKQEANKPDVSAIERERDDYKTQLEELRNMGYLKDKGVKTEDTDYVMFKVKQLVDEKTDFKKAADKFLKENPRYTGRGYRVTTGSAANAAGNVSGTAGNVNDTINDAIRAAARR